jgi:hypothetical protein
VAPLVRVIGDGMRRRTLLVALAGLAVVLAAETPVLSGPAVVVASGAIVFALWPDGMRRRMLFLVLAGLAGVGLWWWLQPGPPPPVTRDNFTLIEHGMGREEVYAILGPPGDYTTKRRSSLAPAPELRSGLTEWQVDDAIYWVRFDGSSGVGVVNQRGFWPNIEPERPDSPSFLQRTRRDLRRLFRME